MAETPSLSPDAASASQGKPLHGPHPVVPSLLIRPPSLENPCEPLGTLGNPCCLDGSSMPLTLWRNLPLPDALPRGTSLAVAIRSADALLDNYKYRTSCATRSLPFPQAQAGGPKSGDGVDPPAHHGRAVASTQQVRPLLPLKVISRARLCRASPSWLGQRHRSLGRRGACHSSCLVLPFATKSEEIRKP